MGRARSGRSRGWALLLGLIAVACTREDAGKPAGEDASAATHELDVGAIRAAAIDGLEATAEDPVTVRALGIAAALAGPDVAPALATATERLLARLGRDPRLEGAADRFFAAVQDSDALRGCLADYARRNPELDLTELTAGFVAHVDQRLTRPEVAEAIAETLRAELQAADARLAAAVLIDAEVAELLAEVLLLRLADAKVEAALRARLGSDPATLERRLIERFAEPRRASFAVEALGEVVASEAGTLALATILDHERTATWVAEGLTKLLADPAVGARGEALFALALADELDVRAFERTLGELLDEPAVRREAEVLLTGLARADYVREQLAALVALVALDEDLGDELVAGLD